MAIRAVIIAASPLGHTRLFDAIGVGIDWRRPEPGPFEDEGQVVLIAVPDDALARPSLIGATIRGSRWAPQALACLSLHADPRTRLALRRQLGVRPPEHRAGLDP